MNLSNFSRRTQTSAIFFINDKATAMQASGKDVFNLSIGAVAASPVPEVCQAAIDAINSGLSNYTSSMGDIKLRESISAKLERENSTNISTDQIIVTCGAKFAIFASIAAVADEGQEVIIFAPFWNSYSEVIKLLGIKPVIVPCNPDLSINIAALESAINPKTAMILFNNPNNPIGNIVSDDDIQAIAKIAIKHSIYIVSDELYEHILFDGAKFNSFLAVAPEAKDLTIIVNGVSKFAVMPGWRVGFAAGPKSVIEAMALIQSHVTTNTSCISQKAAIAAVDLGSKAMSHVLPALSQCKDILCDTLDRSKYVNTLYRPKSGLFVCMDCRELCEQKNLSEMELSKKILDIAKVATIPGDLFGSSEISSRFIRVAFCNPDINYIKSACQALHEGIEQIANS